MGIISSLHTFPLAYLCSVSLTEKAQTVFFLSFFYRKMSNFDNFEELFKTKGPQNTSFTFQSPKTVCAVSCYCRNAKRNHSSSVFTTTVKGGKRQVWTIPSFVLKTPCYNVRRCCKNDRFLPNNLSFDELLLCHQLRLVKANPSWIVQSED